MHSGIHRYLRARRSAFQLFRERVRLLLLDLPCRRPRNLRGRIIIVRISDILTSILLALVVVVVALFRRPDLSPRDLLVCITCFHALSLQLKRIAHGREKLGRFQLQSSSSKPQFLPARRPHLGYLPTSTVDPASRAARETNRRQELPAQIVWHLCGLRRALVRCRRR